MPRSGTIDKLFHLVLDSDDPVFQCGTNTCMRWVCMWCCTCYATRHAHDAAKKD